LGSEEFVERMQALVADRSAMTEVPRTQRRPQAKPIEHYRDTIADKKCAMAAAYATGDYTMQEIATCFSVHYATVSRAVRQKQKMSMLDCKT
ncbi:MAG: addiction module toxin RelE, partial [Pseudomonadota bacterium]